VQIYYQADSSSFIDLNHATVSPKIDAKKTFSLSRNLDNALNDIAFVARNISSFADDFKYFDKEKYFAHLNMFREIYVNLMKDSEGFVNSKETKESVRQKWLFETEELRHSLDMK
jgi:hypothetical protein